MLGAWLLLSLEKVPLAMVEAQIVVTGYSRLSVLVSAVKADGGWRDPKAKAALSLLVSGLIIMTRSDLVTLLPLGPSVEGELADLGFGAKRTLWSPYLSTTRLQHDITGIRVESRAIEAHEWWLTEGGERDQKTLAYLEKRVRIDEEKAKPPKPKARGFMERINGLLRWS